MACLGEIKVVVLEGSIRQSDDGKILGTIFWKIGERCFPDSSWSDFLVVILSWWANSYIKIKDRESEKETLDFMDGPFSILCKRVGDSLRCEFVNRSGRGGSICSWEGPAEHVGGAIKDAVDCVLNYCHINGIKGDDVFKLDCAAQKLCFGAAGGRDRVRDAPDE